MNVAHFSKETFQHHKFSIPENLVDGYGPADQIGQVSDAQVATLRRHAGLDYARWIVEVGCGVGQNAIPLMDILPIDAKYLGIDRARDPIIWAQKNITAASPNFWFYPMEIGLDGIGPAQLPVEDGTQDLIFLFSVFTHIFPEQFYERLREFSRALRPGGTVFATLYVIRPGLIQHLSTRGSAGVQDLTFIDMVERGFYMNDPADSDTPVGYSPRKLGTLARRARLVPTRFIKGGWSQDGRHEMDGPDAVIFTKPVF